METSTSADPSVGERRTRKPQLCRKCTDAERRPILRKGHACPYRRSAASGGALLPGPGSDLLHPPFAYDPSAVAHTAGPTIPDCVLAVPKPFMTSDVELYLDSGVDGGSGGAVGVDVTECGASWPRDTEYAAGTAVPPVMIFEDFGFGGPSEYSVGPDNSLVPWDALAPADPVVEYLPGAGLMNEGDFEGHGLEISDISDGLSRGSLCKLFLLYIPASRLNMFSFTSGCWWRATWCPQ